MHITKFETCGPLEVSLHRGSIARCKDAMLLVLSLTVRFASGHHTLSERKLHWTGRREDHQPLTDRILSLQLVGSFTYRRVLDDVKTKESIKCVRMWVLQVFIKCWRCLPEAALTMLTAIRM